MKINTISPSELKLLFDSNASVQLIDIREKYEIEIDGKTNSIHIPMGDLVDRLDEIPFHEKIVFHCASGQRSSNMLKFLQMNNLYKENYYSLEGGFKAWLEIK